MNEDQLEQFLRESPWEHAAVQEHLAATLPDSLRDPRAALVVDDFGFPKQGNQSVGVKRQYSGTLGKVGNCQVAVNLTYVAPGRTRNADQRTWPLGLDLYLPEEWTTDQARRDKAGIPQEVTFRKKWELALDLIDRALRHDVPHRCVVADAGYGDCGEFRRNLRDRHLPYVVGVTPTGLRVIDAATPLEEPGDAAAGPQGGRPRTHATYPEGVVARSPAQLAATADWEVVTWTQDTRDEPHAGMFCLQKVRLVEDQAQRRPSPETAHLLLELRDDELKAYLCHGLETKGQDPTLQHVVEFAHLRWTIEQFHRELKQQLGIDRFEGRKWRAWNHHTTMVLLAYAYLSQLRAETSPGTPLPTLPEVHRAVILEDAIREVMQRHRLPRRQASAIASTMLQGFSDWCRKPRK